MYHLKAKNCDNSQLKMHSRLYLLFIHSDIYFKHLSQIYNTVTRATTP